MKKENVFKSCKKLTASFAAALLVTCAGSIANSLTANADAPKASSQCILDSNETLKSHLASDEKIYGIKTSGNNNGTVYNAAIKTVVTAKVASLPSRVDLTNQFPTPGNQGGQGSCTAWATTYALKTQQEYIEHNIKNGDNTWTINGDTTFSPAYTYNDKTNINGNGIFASEAMDRITNKGACSINAMPYNVNDYLTEPNDDQLDMGSNFKADGWYTILGTDSVKAELANGNGVVTSIYLYSDFYTSENNNTYDVINTDEKNPGFHSVCIIGYDDNHKDQDGKIVPSFKFINSWGPNWGIADSGDKTRGYGYISYDVFEKTAHASDGKASEKTGWAYVMNDESHNDSSKFFTSQPDSGYVKTKTDIRVYTSPYYYGSNTSYYKRTIKAGTLIKVNYIESSNGLPPQFKTSDGCYINAQKAQLEVADSNDLINNILINGNENNSVSSNSNSETSRISFTSNSNVKYNNHNTLKIDYTVNQSDSYNGYAGAKISGDTTVSTNGATGIGFWYMTPAGQNGTVALCMQGSVSKKIAQIPTTNGKWKYYYNTYNFNGSNMSDIEIYINGSENNCVTSPATGTIYIAELAATNGIADNDTTNYYSFSVTASKGGTVSGKSNGTYAEDTSISVTATADSSHKFAGWSNTKGGSIISTDSTYTFNISKDTTLYANFEDITTFYTFSITAGEGGSVSGTASGTYAENAAITVTAKADIGYEFAGWSNTNGGSIISTDSNYSFRINKNTILFANFRELTSNTYTVNVVKGTGCKSILCFSSNSNGKSFVSGKYPKDYSMSLIAYAADGYEFAGWWTNSSFSGDPVGTSYVYNVKVNGDINLYPKFNKVESYLFRINFPTTNTSVTSSHGTQYVQGIISGSAEQGTNITVQANAGNGYRFVGWYDNSSYSGSPLSTDSTYTFTLNKETNIYAKFEEETSNKYRVSVVKGEGCEDVKLNYHTANNVSFESGTFDNNAQISLTAVNKSNYKFQGWYTNSSFSGNPVCTDTKYTFKVTDDVTLYPKFNKVESYLFRINFPTTNTSVTSSHGTQYVQGIISGSAEQGTNITVQANAGNGYEFVGWYDNSSYSGSPLSTDSTYTFTLNKETNIYAKFSEVTITEDSNILIKGISNNISDWTNANDGSYLNITSGSSDYLFNGAKALKLEYSINTNDQYGGYAGRTVSLESTYNNKGTSNYDGVGFWYLTPSGFNGQIALCLQSSSAGLDDLVQLPATNGEWKYYFYETGKTNISDMTFYINGSKNGYTTTSSNGVASGTLYIANMKVTKK